MGQQNVVLYSQKVQNVLFKYPSNNRALCCQFPVQNIYFWGTISLTEMPKNEIHISWRGIPIHVYYKINHGELTVYSGTAHSKHNENFSLILLHGNIVDRFPPYWPMDKHRTIKTAIDSDVNIDYI